ncbi:hypothetical protein ACFX2F_018137 [Malus domestica]
MELQDSGNLVLLGDKGSILWQSFSHPTDTLLPGQEFLQGMQLKSFRNSDNVFHYLEIQSGDLVLYTGYEPPQIYWSLAVGSRRSEREGRSSGSPRINPRCLCDIQPNPSSPLELHIRDAGKWCQLCRRVV